MSVRLLIACPDAKGVVAAVASHLASIDGNILEADQHTDPDEGSFFMRLEFEGPRDLGPRWNDIVGHYRMDWSLRNGETRARLAILAGNQTHCLSDLLWRWSIGELHAEVPLVISNHEAGRAITESFGVEFRCLPVTPENKGEQECEVLALLEGAGVEIVALARYMQVLGPGFVAAYPNAAINIHHSFLPAFAGAKPYHQAFERGVKLIGATSHYVTEELDDGPIIAQATSPVSHRDTVGDLVRKGRDLERVVLAEAVRLHIEDKILVSGRKTVVFE